MTLKTRYAERLSQEEPLEDEDEDETPEVDPDMADVVVAEVLAKKVKEAPPQLQEDRPADQG